MSNDSINETLCENLNTGAFAVFVRQHYPLLLGYLRKRMGSFDEAQDIAQESCERLLRYRDQPAPTLKQLLFRIAINVLTDRGRHQQMLHAQAGHLLVEFGDATGIAKVACPLHKKTFTLDTGRCLSGDADAINVFRVKTENGRVLVELPSAVMLDRQSNPVHACAWEH